MYCHYRSVKRFLTLAISFLTSIEIYARLVIIWRFGARSSVSRLFDVFRTRFLFLVILVSGSKSFLSSATPSASEVRGVSTVSGEFTGLKTGVAVVVGVLLVVSEKRTAALRGPAFPLLLGMPQSDEVGGEKFW